MSPLFHLYCIINFFSLGSFLPAFKLILFHPIVLKNLSWCFFPLWLWLYFSPFLSKVYIRIVCICKYLSYNSLLNLFRISFDPMTPPNIFLSSTLITSLSLNPLVSSACHFTLDTFDYFLQLQAHSSLGPQDSLLAWLFACLSAPSPYPC